MFHGPISICNSSKENRSWTGWNTGRAVEKMQDSEASALELQTGESLIFFRMLVNITFRFVRLEVDFSKSNMFLPTS